MGFLIGKTLQVAGMLMLGVALVVYRFGEQNMNAELAWLLVGSVVFIIGYGLDRARWRGSLSGAARRSREERGRFAAQR